MPQLGRVAASAVMKDTEAIEACLSLSLSPSPSLPPFLSLFLCLSLPLSLSLALALPRCARAQGVLRVVQRSCNFPCMCTLARICQCARAPVFVLCALAREEGPRHGQLDSDRKGVGLLSEFFCRRRPARRPGHFAGPSSLSDSEPAPALPVQRVGPPPPQEPSLLERIRTAKRSS